MIQLILGANDESNFFRDDNFLAVTSARAEWKADCVSKSEDHVVITFNSDALLYEAKNIKREFLLDAVTSSTMTYSFSRRVWTELWKSIFL